MEAHAADKSDAGDATQVAELFEQRVRATEHQQLSGLATPSYPAHRRRAEPQCRLRTPFQRDRDRIVHSKSFRRLRLKTQVFIDPEGDHYRTRMTHTLEACGISRTVARALRLNEDLTEAIGLGHDLGHPPFGHTGEHALDRALSDYGGRRFRHTIHSLGVVEVLERDGLGLNLTDQVRDGIVNHTGPRMPATLEGRIVRLVDRIAYINHDIDDALRAGAMTEGDLPAGEIAILGASGSDRIDCLVHDLVEHSNRAGDIVQGAEVGGAMDRLRKFMFERVYFGEAGQREQRRVDGIIGALFAHYMANAEAVPEAPPGDPEADLVTRVSDYVAGMTDRYCFRAFEQIPVKAAGTQ